MTLSFFSLGLIRDNGVLFLLCVQPVGSIAKMAVYFLLLVCRCSCKPWNITNIINPESCTINWICESNCTVNWIYESNCTVNWIRESNCTVNWIRESNCTVNWICESNCTLNWIYESNCTVNWIRESNCTVNCFHYSYNISIVYSLFLHESIFNPNGKFLQLVKKRSLYFKDGLLLKIK